MKVILIDGFKSEYLKHSPYLNFLTKKYQWGELEMPMGHWAGMEIFFKGKSDNIALFYKTENSSLKWTKNFIWLKFLRSYGRLILDTLINLQRFLRGEELFRTGKIPFEQLWKFDFCIKKPPHYGLPISFKYIGDIDKAGHKYGTTDKRTVSVIRMVDEKISNMDFDIILSDHGMADIKKIISVPKTKNCFIDSDMARYWGGNEELKIIKKQLPLNYGKIIIPKEKKFGDMIFLAKTGVLISPNYWQGNEIIKGMHGYDGKEKDMKAIYIIKREGRNKDLDVKKLHDLFIGILKNGE